MANNISRQFLLGLVTVGTVMANVQAQSEKPEPLDGIVRNPSNIQYSTRLSRLLWKPPPAVDPFIVYDRCNDQEAIASGMDGGSLKKDRANLGLDCANNVGERYAHYKLSGALVLSRERPIIDAIASSKIDDVTSDGLLSLGSYQEPSVVDPIASRGDRRIHFDSSTLNYDGETLRGLALNASNQWLVNVKVSISSELYEYPLSVQPGETFPFAINVESDLSDVENINFNYDRQISPDLDRAIQTTGLPGYLEGNRTDSYFGNQLRNVIAGTAVTDVQGQTLFVTNLEITQPWSNPSKAIVDEVRSIDNVVAVAALRDKNGHVVDVINLPIIKGTSLNGTEMSVFKKPTLKVGESLIIGLPLDSSESNAQSFSIWVGGAN